MYDQGTPHLAIGDHYETLISGERVAIHNKVIGFGGPIGSGKSTAALIASECLARTAIPTAIVPFANGLKDIARRMGWDGNKDARGRRLLQVIGTEAGRAYDPDIWIKFLCQYIYTYYNQRAIIIIDDVRFPNEVEFCKRHGICVYMDGRTSVNEGVADHASETSFPARIEWSAVLTNGGTEGDLVLPIRRLLENNGFVAPAAT